MDKTHLDGQQSSAQGPPVAIDPRLPAGWLSLEFACQWCDRLLRACVDQDEQGLSGTLEIGEPVTLVVRDLPHTISRNVSLQLRLSIPDHG